MSVITTCAQTFIICALQKCDSCYSCNHYIWDWCFSLADYIQTLHPIFLFSPLCPAPHPISVKLPVMYCTLSDSGTHNFKTAVDTIVTVTLVSTGSCPCHYCGQVYWDCSGTECIQCSQDSVDTTQWTVCCLLAASEIWRLSGGKLNFELPVCCWVVMQWHMYSSKQHIFTVTVQGVVISP